MKSLRSTANAPSRSRRGLTPPDLVVACEAVVRRALLAVTVHAEAHVVIDDALGHCLIGDVAMTRGAVDVRANVRRMLEADVRFVRESVDALPRDLDALLRIAGHLLDQRVVG